MVDTLNASSIPIDTVASGSKIRSEAFLNTGPEHIMALLSKRNCITKDFMHPYRDVTSEQLTTDLRNGTLVSLENNSPLLIDCTDFNFLDVMVMGATTSSSAWLDDSGVGVVYYLPEDAAGVQWNPVGIEFYASNNMLYPMDYNANPGFTFDGLVWKPYPPFRCVVSAFERCAILIRYFGSATRMRIGYCLSN